MDRFFFLYISCQYVECWNSRNKFLFIGTIVSHIFICLLVRLFGHFTGLSSDVVVFFFEVQVRIRPSQFHTEVHVYCTHIFRYSFASIRTFGCTYSAHLSCV